MANTIGKIATLALVSCGYTLMGCSGMDAASGPAQETSDSAGSIGLSLQLSSGATIDSASYTIVGPNGFTKTGAIDVSTSSTLTATIGGLPAGTGYSITLSATSTDGNTSCVGSASFDVQARKTAAVTVALTCKEAGRTGSVQVNGKLNVCPVIDSLSANPAEVQVGGKVALSATAHDSDAGPNALSYSWTTTAGTLSSPSDQNPVFTCTTAGIATISLTVADGDPATSCPDTLSAQINCTTGVKAAGTYVAGDFHNHTTCSDGSISMEKLIKKVTDKTADSPWGLDWFVQAGHGGNGNRNCTLVEDATLATPAYPYIATQGPTTTWEASGVTPKGDASGTSPNKNMWRWQSIQEFQYPLIEYLNAYKNLPLFIGVESNGPGHEHISMSVISGQVPKSIDTATLPTTPGYTALGNADALAKWEYCFDRSDTDTSRGAANAFDCSVPGSANETDPSWNATGKKLIPAGGVGNGTKGHLKTLESLKWMATYHPDASYYVPAHLERAGQFNPDGNNGYNVEHLRDFNNAAPKVAFGMETQPGHGASANRGEYQVLRNAINGVQTDSVGGTTYGGTGVYGAQIGGVWDALLGEGRNFWFFASSDWHNRGSFGPDDRRTTQDFYPGEYQRNYTLVRSGADKLRPQPIVDGLRSGNNYATGGQIIDRLAFVACTGKDEAVVGQIASNAAINKTALSFDNCASMGEKLSVAAGTDIVIGVSVRDPEGANFSPYSFPNPSLAQVGVTLPINKPVLDHIDLIGGQVSGYKTPGTPGYSGEWPRNTGWLKADGTTADLSVVPDAAKNVTAAILKTFNGSGATGWKTVESFVDGTKYLMMTFRIPAVAASQYVRLRGTNLPAAVPFETDASGNPLADVYTNANDTARLRIPCATPHSAGNQFDGCPDHLATATGATNPIVGKKAVSYDIAAWSDLWFYSNPIYVEVAGSSVVAGVK